MEKKMMCFSWSIGVLGLVLVLVATHAAKIHSEFAEELTCEEAIDTLMPCQAYLTADEPPTPPTPCCIAVATVNASASTTQERRDLCKCFEKAAPRFRVKLDKAKVLPQLCGVSVPVPIDPSINCDTIP